MMRSSQKTVNEGRQRVREVVESVTKPRASRECEVSVGEGKTARGLHLALSLADGNYPESVVLRLHWRDCPQTRPLK